MPKRAIKLIAGFWTVVEVVWCDKIF